MNFRGFFPSADQNLSQTAVIAAKSRQDHVISAFHAQIYITNLDVHNGRLWDCVDIDPGDSPPSQLLLFTNVAGKTLVETNLTRSQILYAPEAFSVKRVLFTFSHTAEVEDVYAFAESMVFRLWLGQKCYLWSPVITLQTAEIPLAPIRHCSYCRAVYVQRDACPQCGASDFLLTANSAEHGRAFYLDLAEAERIVIANQLRFYVSLHSNATGYRFKKRLRVWCHLEGLHARGIA